MSYRIIIDIVLCNFFESVTAGKRGVVLVMLTDLIRVKLRSLPFSIFRASHCSIRFFDYLHVRLVLRVHPCCDICVHLKVGTKRGLLSFALLMKDRFVQH